MKINTDMEVPVLNPGEIPKEKQEMEIKEIKYIDQDMKIFQDKEDQHHTHYIT